MVEYTCDEIEHHLLQLKEFSCRLGDSMERTADDLRTQGTSPSADLIADLQHYRDTFFKMRTWLGESSAGLDSSHSPSTLTELETTLAGRKARSRALELVARVERLTHVDGDEHLVVAVCQQFCQKTHDEIVHRTPASQETIQSLNDGRHALAVLWTLVVQGDTLDDRQWTDSLEQCSKELGREVATAVARHKLVIRSTPK